jgi:putrescine aminotransferase
MSTQNARRGAEVTTAKDGRLDWQSIVEMEGPEAYELHAAHINSVFVRLMRCMRLDKAFVRAEGAYVWDAEGKRYLDFFGGFGCMNLGHNHPRVVARLHELLNEQRPMIFQTVANRYSAALAANLAAITPGDAAVSFFCSSGTEATEGALKLARKATGRTRIVHTSEAYHGRTLGAISVNGFDKLRTPFEPLLPDTRCVPWGEVAALERELRDGSVAAFIFEPILGYAGVILPPAGYLKECERLCRQYGALLIADEVQTGFGRTGTMFGCEHEGVSPDIVLVGKSLGGGLIPVGAYLSTREVWSAAYGTTDTFILHTNTFGGNSMGCAAALATIETIYEEDLLRRATGAGAYLMESLERLRGSCPFIAEVRGRGLMVAVELAADADELKVGDDDPVLGFVAQRILGNAVLAWLVNRHRIFVGSSQIDRQWLRIYPPLVVSEEQIDEFVNALESLGKDPRSFREMLRDIAQRVVAEFVGKDA